MRAIILAAGAGRRLEPMGWNKPKCLLDVGGKTLLTHTLDALRAVDVDEVGIVVGYRQELVRAGTGGGIPITWVENADYATTNTIHSLWLARALLDDAVILCNGDVRFDAAILNDLLACRTSALSVDEKVCGDEEVKVIVDANRRVVRIGKALPPGDCLGESVGIAKFDRADAMALAVALDRYNEVRCERGLFYETAVDDIVADHELRAVPLTGHRAIEIDTPEDVDAARRLFAV